jgi:hypothetical protein
MRLTDTVVAQGVRVPGRGVGAPLHVHSDGIRLQVLESHVFDATNVYRMIAGDSRPWDMYELPCGSPPYDDVMVEYLQHNGRVTGLQGTAQQGPFFTQMLVKDSTVGANGFTMLRPRAGEPLGRLPLWFSENMPDQEAWDRARWTWHIQLLQDGHGRAWGPMSYIYAALDENGRLLDVGWRLAVQPVGESIEEAIQTLTAGPVRVFMMTMSLLHCSNIETVYVDPPAALSKKHRKKGKLLPGQDLVRYEVLKVRRSPKQVARSGGPVLSSDLGAFHDVRAGFHHYGDCCPGVHSPKGLYFGKHTCRIWVPSYMRGDPDQGAIEKTYKMDPER